jgi:hypothetical protein
MKQRIAGGVLALLIVVAAVLRLWQIDTLPPGFHFDESFEGLEAWRILTDPTYRPIFLTGNFGVAPLNAYANAAMFALFGWLGGEAGPTAMRTTAALAGVLGVLALFALGYELRQLDRRRLTWLFPLFAVGVLATLRWHIHFSRIGIEPIYVPLIWAAALWLLLRGRRTRRWWVYVAAGALLASAMYSYQGAWIIPLLVAPVVVHLWFYDRRQPAAAGIPFWAGAAVAATTAALLFAPLAYFFTQHPDLLILRPAQIAVAGDAPAAGDPWSNLRASVLMFWPFGATGDLDPRRNLPGAPALNLWQALPFWLGVGLALVRVANPAYSILLIGLAGLLLPGILSEYAPHFHRILGATAPAALLAGLGIDAGAAWLTRAAPLRWQRFQPGAWIAAALIAVGAFFAARDYFVRWAALPDLFYAFDAGLWRIGQEIAAHPAEDVVYLTPRSADHPTLAFAWTTRPGSHAAPFSFDGRTAFPLTAGANPTTETYVAIETEDFRTRLLLPEILPAAVVGEQIYDAGGQVYATYYTRAPGQTPQRPPQQPLAVTVGDGIRLAGYDVQPAALKPGDILYLQLHWLVDQVPAAEWTIFTHLLARTADGGYVQVAGRDSPPGAGSLPTTRWQAGWRVLDEYQIALPADLPAGEYTLAAGLYRAEDGQRLPAASTGIILGEVQIDE